MRWGGDEQGASPGKAAEHEEDEGDDVDAQRGEARCERERAEELADDDRERVAARAEDEAEDALRGAEALVAQRLRAVPPRAAGAPTPRSHDSIDILPLAVNSKCAPDSRGGRAAARAHHDGAGPAKVELRENDASEREGGEAEDNGEGLQDQRHGHRAARVGRARAAAVALPRHAASPTRAGSKPGANRRSRSWQSSRCCQSGSTLTYKRMWDGRVRVVASAQARRCKLADDARALLLAVLLVRVAYMLLGPVTAVPLCASPRLKL